MAPEKVDFLKNKFIPLVRSIELAVSPKWGKMGLQQMVEHLSESFRNANGKVSHPLHTSPELVSKFKAFMMSDKLFKENTKSVMMGDEPPVIHNSSIIKAIEELELEVNDFFIAFELQPNRIIANPIFGDLNFNEWVQLLHKHVIHHLTQFGINT